MNLVEGKKLVKLARKTISSEKVSEFSKDASEFDEKLGVFVTLYTYPKKRLRGCIGFVEPIYKLGEGVVRAAKSAAFYDPRFKPLNEGEVGRVVIEVSVLSEPRLLDVKRCEEYLEKIKIGRDGLIIKLGNHYGVLLPHVALEYNWGVKTFLEHCCMKADLEKDRWKDLDCEVYVFETEIFFEKEPGGEVFEKKKVYK